MIKSATALKAKVKNVSNSNVKISKAYIRIFFMEDICKIQLEDNVIFKVTSFETIMDDFDYPGVRVHLEGIPDDKIDIVMWTIRAVIG